MARVLLVEDDEAIRAGLVRGLRALGHAVTSVATGGAAMTELSSGPPDVVVLDLGLPDVDGARVLEVSLALKAAPVIVATARDDEAEVVRLLNAGADDYLVKPFSAAQMDARIRAVLRRTRPAPDQEPELRVGDLVLDPVGREVTLDGRALELTRKEFDLLQALMQRPGEVVSRRQLLADVWQQPWGGADRTVDVHLSWLRRKLGESAAQPRYLVSVRGVGVKIVEPEA
ncbi:MULTISPECIES: response regulator transcription factor [unclassified Nocardioides]|uniref:response regulator transcription factor n=1 Tax=unclassified Nocardioides TaxID=2615069 RepID=UPI00115014AB|nr:MULTISPECIES: response regulator transcription factor [unclassified Nocardioides]TQK71276.1 DNA-binding response OmpR family regulator [Nocardioides sp. SLBN-35]WGY04557.1 response regulator transcription factor [Nocardioides sp. QY071]